MKILIAEDNHFYRLALKTILVEWGYEVVEARDGSDAWNVLSSDDRPKMAILDWMMPGYNGVDLCRMLRSLNSPEPTYIIILTSLDGKENVVAALNAGADDFIHKPFDRDQLKARLKVGERIVGLQTTQTIIYTLARSLEAKSPFTQGHSDRVVTYSIALADHLHLSDEEKDLLSRGGLLHDIGKISVPDHILDKPAALEPAEYAIIMKHPAMGVEIIKPIQALQDVLPLIRWHHERLDGRGYPDGLTARDIPTMVRVLSVADVYDALSSRRPYRPAMSHDECLAMMRENAAGGGLDPDLIQEFSALGPLCQQLGGRDATLGPANSVKPPAPLPGIQEFA